MQKSNRNKLSKESGASKASEASDSKIMFSIPDLSSHELAIIIAALNFSKYAGNLTPPEQRLSWRRERFCILSL